MIRLADDELQRVASLADNATDANLQALARAVIVLLVQTNLVPADSESYATVRATLAWATGLLSPKTLPPVIVTKPANPPAIP